MLNSTRLVMDAENGLWIEEDDFRVIKAYSASPRESETTLFLWKNNLHPYERQKTYGRVARNSPFLENLKVVEGLIERLQRRRSHIRSILQTNGYMNDSLSFPEYRETPAIQSCPNLDQNSPIIDRNEKGVSRITIKNRPESLAIPNRESSLKQKIATHILPPTMNNVHHNIDTFQSYNNSGDEAIHEIESISTEYASSTLPVDVDDRGSHHFFSSLEDDSLVFSPDGEEEEEGERTSHRSTVAAMSNTAADGNLLAPTVSPPAPPSEKTLPFKKKKNIVVDQRIAEDGVKTHIQDAFYHSTEIIDVDSPYNSEGDSEVFSTPDRRSNQHSQHHTKSYGDDHRFEEEMKSSSYSRESSMIKSLGNYTPVYNTEDRSIWTPFSSLYSSNFSTSTSSNPPPGKGGMEDCLVSCHHNHSFSQDSSDSGSIGPPPSDSRLPPDGHEFPPDYKDPTSTNISGTKDDLINCKSSNCSSEQFRALKLINTNRLITRHDEKSIKSVKAKIAMFQSSPPSQASNPSNKKEDPSSFRFDSKTRSMTNVSSNLKRSPVSSEEESKNKIQNRSQSLLEIPLSSSSTHSSQSNNTLVKRFNSSGYIPIDSLETRRRSNISKLKGLVIPESGSEVSHETKSASSIELPEIISKDLSEAKRINLETPKSITTASSSTTSTTTSIMTSTSSNITTTMSTIKPTQRSITAPPWKQSSPTSHHSQYSPAFKRKPFSLFDDSPTLSDPPKARSTPLKDEYSSSSSTLFEEEMDENNPRLLKRESVEAINRKNILDSCKKSSGVTALSRKNIGKPASRSSSFTIAERKKSFENGSKPENRRFSREIDVSRRSSSSVTPTSSRRSSKSSDITLEGNPRLSFDDSNEDEVDNGNSDNILDNCSHSSWKSDENKSVDNQEKCVNLEEEMKDIDIDENWGESKDDLNNDSNISMDIIDDSLFKLGEEACTNVNVLYTSSKKDNVLYSGSSKLIPSNCINNLNPSLPPPPQNSHMLSKPFHPPDRKYSVPIYSNNDHVKMREKKNDPVPSRPSSLVDTAEMKVFEVGNLGPNTNPSHVSSPIHNETIADCVSKSSNNSTSSGRRAVSVNDIRRAFEKAEASLSLTANTSSNSSGGAPSHNRMSSIDSTTSEESSIPTPHYYGSVSSLISGQSNLKDHYGSITSLASSTSLISPQELQGLIDEANQSLEESGTPSHEIMVIVLHREFTAGSIGITLAGGVDYENKDITVHKVIPGTLADRDGRIQKGDRVLSINGRSTKGVTHREALSILKGPRAEVVLVLSRSRSVTPAEYDRTDFSSYGSNGRPPKILESPLDHKSLLSDLKFVDVPRSPPVTVVLKKEGTGLGFSLEGGKDSPVGDRPLTIKKIFTGGAADKSSILKIGDEILSVNNTDCTRMSRIEAWNFMKKLSDGMASIVVRQKLDNTEHSPPTPDVTEKSNPNILPGSHTSEESHSKLEANR
nr:serine-rich adhesin for platelets-like isoform X6 [Lepeophtheirus salmonis]